MFRGRALFFLADLPEYTAHLPIQAAPITLAATITASSKTAWADFLKKYPEYPRTINKQNYPDSYPTS